MSAAAHVQLPLATPATADLVCWLWAAIPHRDGRLHVPTAAKALGVSESTIRRWIAHAHELELDDYGMSVLKRRAILRGRGHLLWPRWDVATVRRTFYALESAQRAENHLRRQGPSDEWRRTGKLDAHQVHLVHYPRAHVYGVAVTSTSNSRRKIQRVGTILSTAHAPNRFAADVIKYRTLEAAGDARCIAPRSLVPVGRTEVWLETAGPRQLGTPTEDGLGQAAPGWVAYRDEPSPAGNIRRSYLAGFTGFGPARFTWQIADAQAFDTRIGAVEAGRQAWPMRVNGYRKGTERRTTQVQS